MATTNSVPASNTSGADFGTMISGDTYIYTASGCAQVNGYWWADPNGNTYTNSACTAPVAGPQISTGGLAPGLIQYSLIGRSCGSCYMQLGSDSSFQALPVEGLLDWNLSLVLNDSDHSDNSGSWNASVTHTVEGVYDCIVSSDCGSQISTGATLWVTSPCDGIPDWWRLQYFGTTATNDQSCATCDASGDQIDNLQKYEYGLNPLATNVVDVLVNNANTWATNQVVTLNASAYPFPFFKVSLYPNMSGAVLFTNMGSPLTYTLPSTNNGTYDLFLQYTDAGTNALGPILFKPITLDTIPPVVQITSPTNGLGNDAFVHLRATVYDPVPTNGIMPDRHHPVSVWINGQPYYRLIGNQLDIPRFPVLPYTNNIITVLAQDAAGNTNQASVNWYVAPTSNAPPPTFTVSGFPPGTVIDLPNNPQTWVCGTMNSLYATVTAIVNSNTLITMNVHSNQFGYTLPLGWGTNTVLIVASDVAGNASSNTYLLAVGNRYQFAITSDPQIDQNYVSGYVSAERDAGLPTATNLLSVTVNGVGTTWGSPDGNGNVWFTTTNTVPWPSDGSLLMLNTVITWADGAMDPSSCPDDWWITTKQTSSATMDIRTEQYNNNCPPVNPDSADCKLVQSTYSFSLSGDDGSGNVNSADGEQWAYLSNPSEPLDPNACGLDGSTPDPNAPYYASQPDAYLRVGMAHSYSAGLSDATTWDNKETDEGFEAVQVPFDYPAGGWVVLSFTDVGYGTPPGTPVDPSLVSYPGGIPLGNASFLVQASPGEELSLELDGPGDVVWEGNNVGWCGVYCEYDEADWISFGGFGASIANVTVSPNPFNMCVGTTQGFTASGAPGTFTYSWSASSGTITTSGSQNESAQITFTTAGNASVTATAGPLTATANGTVVEVASLAADSGNVVGGITDIVDWASSGVVTVTATPNPNIPPANLPGCWQLSGNNGTQVSPTLWTVPKSVPGFTTIIASAGTSAKTVVVAVVECTFTVLNREPSGASNDYGHTWWEFNLSPGAASALVDPNTEVQQFVNTAVNYDPSTNNTCICPGIVFLGSPQGSATCLGYWIIPFNSFKSAVEYSYNLQQNPGKYICFYNNCSVQTKGAAAAAGINVGYGCIFPSCFCPLD